MRPYLGLVGAMTSRDFSQQLYENSLDLHANVEMDRKIVNERFPKKISATSQGTYLTSLHAS